jgi:hypothetical protein
MKDERSRSPGFAETRDTSGAFGVPRIPTRPPASDDSVVKSLNPKDKPARQPPSFRRAPGRDGRSRPGLRARRNLTRLRDLDFRRHGPPTPFGPGDPASPRNHVAFGDLSSRDHRPGPLPRSRARRDDARDGVVPTPAASRAGPSLGTTCSYGFRSKRERFRVSSFIFHLSSFIAPLHFRDLSAFLTSAFYRRQR